MRKRAQHFFMVRFKAAIHDELAFSIGNIVEVGIGQ